MKAVVVGQADGQTESLLEYRDVPDPEIAQRRVLIRVDSASVNRTDLTYVAGRYGQARSIVIPGEDVCGVVEAVGPEVDNVKPGTR